MRQDFRRDPDYRRERKEQRVFDLLTDHGIVSFMISFERRFCHEKSVEDDICCPGRSPDGICIHRTDRSRYHV